MLIDNKIICDRCTSEMVSGIVIDPKYHENCWHGIPTIDKDSMEVLDCYKCPKCGHSDYKDKPNFKIKMDDGDLKYFKLRS
jgi:hypothetical protein